MKQKLLSILKGLIRPVCFILLLLYPMVITYLFQDFIIPMVGILIIFTIFCFSMNRWGKLGNIIITILCIGFSLLFLAFFSYRTTIISEEETKAIQETESYDALQNRETEDYRMVVLDNTWEKDVRYYSKKYQHYVYYRVRPDLSVKEISVTETAFLPSRYKGE